MSRQLDQRAGVTVTDGAVPAARQDVAVSPEAAVAASAVEESCEYYLWQDNTIYGPVELPMLARWIGERRIKPRDWVFVPNVFDWVPILEVPEITGCFYRLADKPQTPPPGLTVESYVKYYRVQQSKEVEAIPREIEKRHWIRLPLSTSMTFCEIHDISPDTARTHQAYTRNISEGGIGFEMSATLETGTIIDIEIDFCPEIVRAQARVAHCRVEENGTYRIGAAFRVLEDAERLKIRRYIRSCLHTASQAVPAQK